MKPVRILITAIVTTFVLTACGGKDFCDRAAKDAEDCGEVISDADLEACKSELDGCDNKDQKVLNSYYDCITEGPAGVCFDDTSSTTTDDFEDELAALMACIEQLEDLSTECAEGMYGSSPSSTSWTSSTSQSTSSASTY
ncbi:MAG: hypothetical protein GWP91_18110 [Rhodobacterales bacterium]|nr:hypothetical protein [Rhodobacterales bacterium]